MSMAPLPMSSVTSLGSLGCRRDTKRSKIIQFRASQKILWADATRLDFEDGDFDALFSEPAFALSEEHGSVVRRGV